MAAGTILLMKRPSPRNRGHDKQGYCLLNAPLGNPGNNLTPVRYFENATGYISKESAQQSETSTNLSEDMWAYGNM